MAGLILFCIFIVVVGTFALMLISEKCEVPWKREIGIGKRREVAWDDAIDDALAADIFNSIDWDSIEPDKTYAFNLLALGQKEDDEVDWWVD